MWFGATFATMYGPNDNGLALQSGPSASSVSMKYALPEPTTRALPFASSRTAGALIDSQPAYTGCCHRHCLAIRLIEPGYKDQQPPHAISFPKMRVRDEVVQKGNLQSGQNSNQNV